MNLTKIIFVLIILCTISACSTNEKPTDSKFNGMWSLGRYETFDNATGKWIPDTTFTGSTGHIMYDGQGHMSVQINRKGYKDFDASKRIDSLNMQELKEYAKLFGSNFTYMAEYKVNGNTVEHKKLSATTPSEWGKTVIRDFEFRNDTLILIPKEMVNGKNDRLIWIKMK